MITKYILTRRRNRIVSREIQWFDWSQKAIEVRRNLNKVVINSPKLSIPKAPKQSKSERFKNLPFSEYHNKLVASLYDNNREYTILKQQAEKSAHELKIRQLALARKHSELSNKNRLLKQVAKRIVLRTTKPKNSPTIYHYHTIDSNNRYEIIKSVMFTMNKQLPEVLPIYKCISLFPPNATTACLLFVNSKAA